MSKRHARWKKEPSPITLYEAHALCLAWSGSNPTDEDMRVADRIQLRVERRIDALDRADEKERRRGLRA